MRSALEILKQDFDQVVGLLKTNRLHAFFSKWFFGKKKSRWHLILGASGVGKTSLLVNSELRLLDIHNRPALQVYPTRHCQWLFVDESNKKDEGQNIPKNVFLDMTGRYGSDVWLGWLKLLSSIRGTPPIESILIPFDLKYSQPGSKQVEIIQSSLSAIARYIRRVPVYIVFTQCDYIAGFSEFFEDLSVEEQKERFGVEFDSPPMQEDFLGQFENKFDALIQRLNERMIWRLHNERQSEKKMLIKQFPVQLGALKDSCRKLIQVLVDIPHLNLQGLYFTSALQKGHPINYLSQRENMDFPLVSERLRTSNLAQTKQKTFFISQLFHQILNGNKQSQKPSKVRGWSHYFVYTFSVFILVVGFFWSYKTYFYGNVFLKKSETLFQSISKNEEDLLATLSQLDQVRTRLVDEKKHQAGWLYTIQPFNRLLGAVETTYVSLLKTQFSTQLKNLLELQLKHNEINQSARYSALKVYLMLGGKIKKDPVFISNWFQVYWKNHVSHAEADLSKYLRQMLERGEEISVDLNLVKQVRQKLEEAPLYETAFAVLSAKLLKGDSDDVQYFSLWKLNEVSPPLIYQKSQVVHVYQKVIPLIYQNLLKGDEVLQAVPKALYHSKRTQGLILETRRYYLEQYRNFWKSSLVLNMRSLNSLKKLKEFSGSWMHINGLSIRENTLPIDSFPDYNHIVSSEFEQINIAMRYWDKLPIFEAIKNLNAYLTVVLDSHAGAFIAARMRMEEGGGKDPISQLKMASADLPEPFREGFASLSERVWDEVLSQAKAHVNLKWQEKVLPLYHANLKGRYPFFKGSSEELTVSGINRFFGVKGAFTQFVEQYIHPFVDQQQFYWEWKKIDGKGLDISQKNLDTFIRGMLIKKMFFSGNRKTAGFGFSLKPGRLNGRFREAVFQFNHDAVHYTGRGQKANHFVWPGDAPYIASFQVLDRNRILGKQLQKGLWSIFRLLDENLVENNLDSKKMDILFDMDGYRMRALLAVDSEVNPFIPGILSAFRCSEEL